ncbi:uncharacterized protein ACRADG_000480 [Cochliomyia hominivorax]
MDFISGLIVILSCLLTLCQTQSYSYSAQRRSGYGYSSPSYSSNYYNQPKTYYQSSAAKTSSYSNNPSKASYANSQYKQSSTRNSYPYSSSSSGYYNSYRPPPAAVTTTRQTIAHPYSQSLTTSSPNYNYRNSFSSSTSKGSYSSASDPYNSKNYLSNSYNSKTYQKDNKNKNLISKADAENAKFVGAVNQEDEENSPRTAHLKRRKLLHRYGGLLSNPCIPFGRDAGRSATPPPKEQGRILWDVNVYNIYPQTSAAIGCGGYGGIGGGFGYGGALGGGGLLADPIAPVYYPPGVGISNFLRLFAPGILQNSLAVTARPLHYADYGQASTGSNDSQNDPNVDPNFDPAPAPLPMRRPNRVYYDSAGAPPVTPGQLVGGISTTVNGIIQQLTGNVQPVYG